MTVLLQQIHYTQNASQPIMRLPPDVLSAIFVQAQDPSTTFIRRTQWLTEKKYVRDVWVPFKHVCQHWRTVSLACQALELRLQRRPPFDISDLRRQLHLSFRAGRALARVPGPISNTGRSLLYNIALLVDDFGLLNKGEYGYLWYATHYGFACQNVLTDSSLSSVPADLNVRVSLHCRK